MSVMYGENGSATYGRNGVSERKNTSEIVHIRSSPYVITLGGGGQGGSEGGVVRNGMGGWTNGQDASVAYVCEQTLRV